MAALAAITGLTDYVGDAKLRASSDALKHMLANVTAVVLELVNLVLRFRNPDFIASTGVYISGVVVLILLYSGWKGGDLVYRHGVGVHDTVEPVRAERRLLRIVAYRKAILAGAAGAWSGKRCCARLMLLGFQSFDVVQELGTLAFPNGSAARMVAGWNCSARGRSAASGRCSTLISSGRALTGRPPLQGLAFAALPAALAALLVYPQLRLMHLHRSRCNSTGDVS